MRPMLATVLVALAVPAVAGAAAAGGAGFRAPGRTLYCQLGDPPAPIVLQCWRSTDGKSLGMLPTGRALRSPENNSKNLHMDSLPVLKFGQSWSKGGYKCTSRRLGVTCSNRSHHGWWFGRYKGYRLF